MTPERWRQVEEIFQAALDRHGPARAAYLDAACAGDAGLRRDVESMLEAHHADDRFLESSALRHAARDLAGDTPRLSPGQRLGAYELIEQIGAGGMGEVWRALDPPLRRQVAIKVLSSQYSRDPDRLRRFEQEAQAAGMLNHPNVLAIYAVGEQEHSPYLVTELLEGETLRHQLERGPVSEAKTIEYANQIAQGLAAAHAKGIVHRDLKPENIFITTDGRVKILDFGLAKLAPSGPLDQAQTRTASGVLLGTPAYMSPEQVRGLPADDRSDIFAVGAVLYEMLAGRRPFLGETSAETMTAILKHDPAPVPGISPQMEQIVRHCLQKEPGARCQSARDLAFQLHLVRHPSSPPAVSVASGIRRSQIASATVALILLAALATVAWWLMPPKPSSDTAHLTRLTFDSGLTTDPAFSPDGRLAAYASDRAGAGNLDIWIQPLATGDAVKLTSDPADESEPTFSSDGTRIAFRSERDGGGIYTVSAFGGEPRLVAPQGRRPRFSPDGTRIAYWVGIWYTGRIFTVSSTGGPPSPVQPEFVSALYPVWSTDGSKLLFMATRDPKELAMNGLDWWVAPASGGPAVRTGALDILRRQRITDVRTAVSFIKPADWIGDDVFFSGSVGESTNLWQIAVSPETGKASGSARRLTFGTAEEAKPSVAPGGRVMFASLTHALNIWSVQIASDDGKVNGTPQQLTSSAFDAAPTVSADGRRLTFISRRLGNSDVWLKDLESGKEIPLTTTPLQEQNAEISADGSRICYAVYDGSQWVLYQVPTTGGVSEKISDDGALPWDWSPDGSQILYMIEEGRRQPTTGLGLFDVATRQKRDYVLSPKYSLARARFSPDGRWIAVMAFDASGVHIVVMPFRREGPPREDEWIAITEHQQFSQDKPRWSPGGNLLYYTSEVDGFRCIWAQRLDPATKRPIGPPLGIYHSHSARRSLANAGIPIFWEIALTRDKLFFNLGETLGNIWMAEWK